MNFKEWMLTEGWSIDLSNIPFEELQMYLAGSSTAAVHWLANRAKFNYYGKKDLPKDFIKVVPFNRAKEVPTLQLKKYLPSFEGMKIYYGYTFVTPNSYQDSYTSSYKPRSNKAIIIDNELQQVSQYNLSSKFTKTITPNVKKLVQDLVANDIDFILNLNTNTYKASYSNLQTMIDYLWDQISQVEENPSRHLYFAAEEYFIRMWREALLRKKQELQQQFTKLGDIKDYLDVIKIAFSKVLKDFNSKYETPEGDKVRRLFLQQGAENFYRLMQGKKYDFVLYPESSSKFNELLAKKLAGLFGTTAIKGFSKKPASEITIDEPALRSHFGPDATNKMAFLKQGGIGYTGLDRATPYKPVQIKNFAQPLRRYVNMWNVAPGYKATGKRLLIIDDNIDAGGTLERLYDLIKQQQPKSVDIYSPLYIGGGHGVTHG